MITGMGTFGENLKEAMRRRAVAKDALAGKLHLTEPQIDKWLAPTANPRLVTMFRLAKAVGVSIESLCEGADAEYDAMRGAVKDEDVLLELWRRTTDDAQRALVLGVLRVSVQAAHPPAEPTRPEGNPGSRHDHPPEAAQNT